MTIEELNKIKKNFPTLLKSESLLPKRAKSLQRKRATASRYWSAEVPAVPRREAKRS